MGPCREWFGEATPGNQRQAEVRRAEAACSRSGGLQLPATVKTTVGLVCIPDLSMLLKPTQSSSHRGYVNDLTSCRQCYLISGRWRGWGEGGPGTCPARRVTLRWISSVSLTELAAGKVQRAA